ncbi:MAG: hypothetical protein M1840_006137 [Geoglossum simile]|nr:MAG: hypothetical protein M1840_006137 [Geoglossum simile]
MAQHIQSSRADCHFKSGVAIATPAGYRASLKEIDAIDDWGPQMRNDPKVPSVISYSPMSKDEEQQWGRSLSPKAVAMVHTKLELDVHDTSGELDLTLQALDGMCNLHFQYVRASRGLPEYTWKAPEEIVEDYLSKIFDYLLEKLDCFTAELRARISTDIVITVPANWSYRAKNSTFRALTRAGFNKDTFPQLKDILLISEPEAAAIYTARYLREGDGADFLKKGDHFVLCDAGGGTVDVVSYKVKELQPFEIEAVSLPTGDKCGSIFIDLAFKRWLRDLLGEKDYQKLDQGDLAHKISSHEIEGEEMRVLMHRFTLLKRRFWKGQRDMKMDLPSPLDDLNVDGVVGGEITITNTDMKSFFDPCVDRIVELIKGQIAQVERLRVRPKNVFMVGGFAESRCLQEEIEHSLRLRNIQLRRPDTSWTAVVRGAAVFGIEKFATRALAAVTACPRSFGVTVSESFSEIRHNRADHSVDPHTRAHVAKEQLLWLIKKGDLILSDKPKMVKQSFTINFPGMGQRKGKIPIYAYSDDDAPDRLCISQNELAEVDTLEYDLTDAPLSEFVRRRSQGRNPPSYSASLKLTMRLNPRVLEADLSWKDRTLCSTGISYL